MNERHASAQRAAPRARWLAALAAASIVVSLALLGARLVALDEAIAAAASLVSADGVVSAENRAFFAAALSAGALAFGGVGLLLVAYSLPRSGRALSAAVSWDPLALRGLRVPRGGPVLVASAALGIGTAALWVAADRIGAPLNLLFVKEGPAELVTFLLDVAAGALCVAAAVRFRLRDDLRAARILYFGCGLVLILVGLEEINWGQTLLGFDTPSGWAAINHQQETSLHNLLDRAALTAGWRAVAVVFGVGSLALVALSVAAPRSIAAAIAPPPSLLALALVATYGGLRVHPELIELLLSIFFAFYAYRLLVAARSTDALGADSAPGRADVAGERGRGPAVLGAARIAVPIVLIAVLLYRIDASEALERMADIPLGALLVVLVAMVVGLVISALKWAYALQLHGLHYPFRFLLRVLCTGFFLNSFLPTAVGGDAYRVYRTIPADRFRSLALSAVLIERAAGFLVLIAFGGIGALLLADRSELARAYCGLLLGGLAAGALGFVALERGWLRDMTRGWRDAAPLNAVRHSFALLSHRGFDWMALLAASVAFQALSIGILFSLFAILSAGATLAECALIAAAVGVAAAVPLSINGLGLMEGALVAAAVALGIDYEPAVLVAFLRRLLATVVAACCGVSWAVAPSAGRSELRRLLRLLARRMPTEVPAAAVATHGPTA